MCVSTCLKGGVGGRKSQRCQLFTVHCSRFRRLEGLLVVVDEGGGPEVRARAVTLVTIAK